MVGEVRTSILSRLADEGFAGKLGLKLLALAPGHAIVEMTPGKDDTDIFGAVHGGAVFSLVAEAFQMSCNAYGTIAVALSLNIVYHNQSKEGQRLRAECREIHCSQKIATYEISVKDDNDVLIASCQAVAYRKKEQLPILGEGC